jgi:hypothetical protein
MTSMPMFAPCPALPIHSAEEPTVCHGEGLA